MGAVFFLLRRYLLPLSSNLLSFALWVSVAGVALGVIQLMLVLAVMSGFQNMLRDNYTRITSDIVVIPRHQRLRDKEFLPFLLGNKGIAAATATGLGQGMVLKDRTVGGVVLEGVDLSTTTAVTDWNRVWLRSPIPVPSNPRQDWIWLGAQLAQKLQVKTGDTVDVLLGEAQKIIPFTVTAITKFGIYDHDLRYAYIDVSVLNRLFDHEDLEPMYKLKLKDGVSLDAVAGELTDSMGDIAIVKKWSDINQNIFLAVQHQKKMLFMVLEIIIGLAAMNVVNLLMMSSYQRRRDVAILRTMGMRLGGVFLFFVAQGAAVGSVGVALGVVLGFGVCRFVERFQPAILSEAVYNVTKLPLRIEPWDVGVIGAVAVFLCILFSVVPALKAALSRPVKALRYE